MSEDLRFIEGRIATINPAKRGIAIRNSEGITEGVTWDPARDKEFSRLQIGWSAKVTLEKRGDQWIAIHQEKGPRLPRDQKPPAQDDVLIAAEVLLKAWTELWPNCNTPDTITFKDARKDILDAVKEDLPALLAMRGGSPV